jgi:hypothetical protein
MSLTDGILFAGASDWATGAAEGFVHGRIPAEDALPLQDFISRISWPHPHGIPPPPIPNLKALGHNQIPVNIAGTAGPFNVVNIKIPKGLSDFLGLPPSSVGHQKALIKSTRPSEPISVSSILTCTDKHVFAPVKPGAHPPHPVIQFSRPVGRVHVRLTNLENDKLLWDASYDLKGQSVLSNMTKLDPIKHDSLVPDYIPACTFDKAKLRLDVDAELNNPIKIAFYNPASVEDDSKYIEGFPRVTPPAPRNTGIQTTLNQPNAIVCKEVKQSVQERPIIDISPKHKVYLPPKYSDMMQRLDHSRDPTSEKNPNGVPMLTLVSGLSGPKLSTSIAAKEFGSGHVGLVPRRPPMGGEIQVDQLERGNFHVFDSRKMPTNILKVDKTAIVTRPQIAMQPTVARTIYSPMWQGIHDKNPHLHPSIKFRHPANVAKVELKDLTTRKLLWDAIFNVQGNHKIAADQTPVGGSIPDFKGIDPPTNKGHEYSLKIEVDDPSGDRPIDYWRHSEFLFGATRPVRHSEFDIAVNASKVGGSSLINR